MHKLKVSSNYPHKITESPFEQSYTCLHIYSFDFEHIQQCIMVEMSCLLWRDMANGEMMFKWLLLSFIEMPFMKCEVKSIRLLAYRCKAHLICKWWAELVLYLVCLFVVCFLRHTEKPHSLLWSKIVMLYFLKRLLVFFICEIGKRSFHWQMVYLSPSWEIWKKHFLKF